MDDLSRPSGDVFFPGQVSPKVAYVWASAYVQYASAAQAGTLFPVPGTMLTDVIVSKMLTDSRDLFGGFSSGVETFWSRAFFTAPGFIPMNPVTQETASSESLRTRLNSLSLGNDRVSSAKRIAEIIHSYTSKIMVTSTTLSSPPVVLTTNVLF